MNRKVEFVPDGTRVFVAPAELVACWRLHCPTIPAQYACGTVQHETDYTLNEKDTEPSGYESFGIFQLGTEEQTQVGMGRTNLYALDDSVLVMGALAQNRLSRIEVATHALSYHEPDLWAYLAVAHNQGLGACLKTINLHGIDWTKYKQRNLDDANKALAAAQELGDAIAIAAARDKLAWWLDVFSYGDDCISGGARWPG